MSTNQNGAFSEQNAKIADAAKANINKGAEQGVRVVDAAQQGLSHMAELNERATEQTKQVMQTGVEAASRHAREASERATKMLGFTGAESDRLARQSKQNLEAVTRCSTVLGQAFQDASRGWLEIGQKQWQRNLDGVNRLTGSKSVQEFVAIRTELVRESLEHMVQDSRAIAETTLRAVDEAGKTFSGAVAMQQGQSQAA